MALKCKVQAEKWLFEKTRLSRENLKFSYLKSEFPPTVTSTQQPLLDIVGGCSATPPTITSIQLTAAVPMIQAIQPATK